MRQIHMATTSGGAKITHGSLGFSMKDPALRNGNFVDVMMLEGMDSDSAAYKEEFFGPVFNLFKADSSKEALDLANKSDYGLSSTIFTEDIEKAYGAAQRLRTGSVFVN